MIRIYYVGIWMKTVGIYISTLTVITIEASKYVYLYAYVFPI